MGDELANLLTRHAVGERALEVPGELVAPGHRGQRRHGDEAPVALRETGPFPDIDRKSTRLNSSHGYISYAVFCLKKKKTKDETSTHILHTLIHPYNTERHTD